MNDRGVVLPLTLIVLVVLASLVTALLALGVTEPQISANLLRSQQAIGLAEAGLERAVAHFQDPANKSVVDTACVALPCGSGGTLWQDVALAGQGTYTVTWRPIAFATILVESRGTTGGALMAERTVRVVLTTQYDSRYAILARKVEAGGHGRVLGSLGLIHGNEEVELNGSSWVDQTATTAGSTCAGCDARHVGNAPGSGAGRPEQSIPSISPASLLPRADFVFGDDAIPLPTGATGCTSAAVIPKDQIYVRAENRCVSFVTDPRFLGWAPKPRSAGSWSYSGVTTPPNGTFYASGEIRLQASPGTAGSPWEATLVAASVDIQGHPTIQPYLRDLLIVSNRVEINGTGGDASLRGAIVASGEVELTGGLSLTGNVLARGEVELSGNATITYNSKTRLPVTGALRIVSWSNVPL
jgi:hypothetical protein